MVQNINSTTSPKNFNSASFSFKKCSDCISFKGAHYKNIEVLQGTSDSFVKKATETIEASDSSWLSEFQKKGYRIILSPTISDAYRTKGIVDPKIIQAEKQNPKGTLGVTYHERFGRKFFIFCDKQPYSEIYTRNIVNHEFSHGIINIKKLDKDTKVKSAIDKDIQELITKEKLKAMTSKERQLIINNLLGQAPNSRLEEITAETLAWLKGAGCFGSGLVSGVKSPKLILEAFSNLADYLKKFV